MEIGGGVYFAIAKRFGLKMCYTMNMETADRAKYYAVRYLTGQIDARQLKWWTAMEGLDISTVEAAIKDINQQTKWTLIKLAAWIVGALVVVPLFFHFI